MRTKKVNIKDTRPGLCVSKHEELQITEKYINKKSVVTEKTKTMPSGNCNVTEMKNYSCSWVVIESPVHFFKTPISEIPVIMLTTLSNEGNEILTILTI